MIRCSKVGGALKWPNRPDSRDLTPDMLHEMLHGKDRRCQREEAIYRMQVLRYMVYVRVNIEFPKLGKCGGQGPVTNAVNLGYGSGIPTISGDSGTKGRTKGQPRFGPG